MVSPEIGMVVDRLHDRLLGGDHRCSGGKDAVHDGQTVVGSLGVWLEGGETGAERASGLPLANRAQPVSAHILGGFIAYSAPWRLWATRIRPG
jgi:hypothetical protein